jgi:membrane protein YqaA with SNARE-associated domain
MMHTTDTAVVSNTPKKSWIYRLYDRALENADSPKAFWLLMVISFAESSFFLLPPDLLLVPMVVTNRSRAWRLAFWATVSSVLGGILGYAIGYYVSTTVGQWLIDVYHMHAGFAKFHNGYNEWGFWIIVLKGLTPIPYKIVTIASGIAHYPLIPFIMASLIARSFRFYLLAVLLWRFGPLAKTVMDRYLGWCLVGSCVLIVSGFFIIRLFG